MSVEEIDTSNLTLETVYPNLSNLSDIEIALDELDKEDEEIKNELYAILQIGTEMETKVVAMQNMMPNLGLVLNDAQNLSGMIAFTSTLAENVSQKVRELDLAKNNVTSVLERVEDIMDLKSCTDGVQSALKEEDYETAAGHVHRFLSLDENVLRLSAGASEGGQLDTSFKLLHDAREKLKTIVHRQFDAAVRTGDVASVERFFKIFPLIKEHEAGLSKFAKYLCSQLSDTADKNLNLTLSTTAGDKRANVLYADTLTLLFESIARVVEVHQPLVETYYGLGRMITLIEFLQKECDRQARKILEHFKKNREFENKVQLVQQLLDYNKTAGDKLNMKDLDILLTEVTLLHMRSELYLRFARRRLMADLVPSEEEAAEEEQEQEVEQFLVQCELSRHMQELIGNYIQMEEYFMKEMVSKAILQDHTEPSCITSTMVDEVFFVVKKCVRRALSSSSVDGVCAMLNHATGVLEQDYREALYGHLRGGFPSMTSFTDLSQAYSLMQSSFHQGKVVYSDSDTQKVQTAFLTALNNAEVSCEFIQTLKSNLEQEISKLYSSQTGKQSDLKLQSCLTDLTAVTTRFKDVLEFGFTQLSNSAIKPRVKPWIDTFLDTSHKLSEEDFSAYESEDPWAQKTIQQLDALIVSFKEALTGANYEALLVHLSNDLSVQLEKAVFKSSFNRLGGLQFDKELRALIAYLTSVTTWTLRDKFARLTQMATILNLEKVTEILDYWGSNSGPLTWRLTPAEVRMVLNLRIDFRSEDIKRLKL